MKRIEFIILQQCNTDNTIKIPSIAAHFDVFSEENVILFPGEERVINSNISIIEIPKDIICEIKAIKDMVVKKKLDIPNYVIDTKGPVKIKIRNNNLIINDDDINNGNNTVNIKKGDRIAIISFAKTRKFV